MDGDGDDVGGKRALSAVHVEQLEQVARCGRDERGAGERRRLVLQVDGWTKRSMLTVDSAVDVRDKERVRGRDDPPLPRWKAW